MIDKELPSIRVFGNPQMYSGYGQATQNICQAISDSRVDAKFVFSGPNKSFSENLVNLDISPKIDLYIQPPPFNCHRSNNYKIGYFYWEADLLPKRWAKDIVASLDEVWVPCELTKKSCIMAGFKKNIEILPTPAKKPKDNLLVQFAGPNSDLKISDSTFKFYSIFQWNERKGYKTLLRAYFEEFSSKENVILILKVNPINHKLHGLEKIKKDILKIKNSISTKKTNLPKILLITENLSNDIISGIHNSCDAFVLPHRGEGWGMPIHDAINHKNLIITTGFGGVTEWLDEDNSFLIEHSMSSVSEMNWNPWYASYQSWAKPSLFSLRCIMRHCFDKKDLLNYKKENLSKIINKFTIQSCSNNIENILSKNRFTKLI